jgi:transketolase
MRNAFAECLYEQGRANDTVCIVVADISPAGSMQKFREEFPDRFVNVGVAEQVMIGLAAGMALRGRRPFAYTIATFSLYRPFEFIRDDLCYQDLPVTVVGIGGGVTYSTLGGTHHAMEDVAIAAAVPNMTVLAPCDPEEVRAATAWCANAQHGPVYLRLGKAGEPVLTKDAAEPFAVGKVRTIRRGRDTCILTYGPIAKMALDVAQGLEAAGESVSLASVHTLKPLDVDGIAALLNAHRRVVVIEEHVPHGGLASRVKEIAWDRGARTQLRCFTLKDAFIHCYGGHGDLLAAHGLEPRAILAQLAASP